MPEPRSTNPTKLNIVNAGNESVTPSKIICVGQNYLKHIKEMGNPIPEEIVIFCKPNSAITSSLRCWQEEPIHYEGELCFLITAGQFSHVGFGLDLTKRKLQKRLRTAGLPWEKAKGFDGAALFSDFVPLEYPVDELSFTLCVNGEVLQSSSEDSMIYKADAILEALRKFMGLADGDIVMTGTPGGVGPLEAGKTYTGTVSSPAGPIVSQSWVAQ